MPSNMAGPESRKGAALLRRIKRFYEIYKGIRAFGYSIVESLVAAYWLETHRRKDDNGKAR